MSDNHLVTDDMTDKELEHYAEQRREAIIKYNEQMAKVWAEMKRQEDEYIRDHGWGDAPAAAEDGE